MLHAPRQGARDTYAILFRQECQYLRTQFIDLRIWLNKNENNSLFLVEYCNVYIRDAKTENLMRNLMNISFPQNTAQWALVPNSNIVHTSSILTELVKFQRALERVVVTPTKKFTTDVSKHYRETFHFIYSWSHELEQKCYLICWHKSSWISSYDQSCLSREKYLPSRSVMNIRPPVTRFHNSSLQQSLFHCT